MYEYLAMSVLTRACLIPKTELSHIIKYTYSGMEMSVVYIQGARGP